MQGQYTAYRTGYFGAVAVVSKAKNKKSSSSAPKAKNKKSSSSAPKAKTKLPLPSSAPAFICPQGHKTVSATCKVGGALIFF